MRLGRRSSAAATHSPDQPSSSLLEIPSPHPALSKAPFVVPSAMAGDTLDPIVPTTDMLAPMTSCGATMRH